MPLEGFSRRSVILKKALKFINKDDWADYGTYLVFGSAGQASKLGSSRISSYRLMSYDQFSEALSGYIGLVLSGERTSVGNLPSDSEFLQRLHALPSDTLRLINECLFDGEIADPTPENVLGQIKEAIASKSEREAIKGGSVLPEHEVDDLDSHYCVEVLDKIDSIMSRVAGLEAIRIKRMPNPKVKRCFEEAMRCYLYGFNMACAAMCRGLLEAALKEVIDPKKQLVPTKQDKEKRDRRASYFLRLVDNARCGGKLTKELSEPGGPADQVKDAGDAAVHDAAKFAAEFPAEKVGWLLDRTRDILVELYGAE